MYKKPDNTKAKSERQAPGNFFTCLLSVFLCAAILSAPAYGQASFGTLFTSPQEREYLDYLREEFVRNSQMDSFNIQDTVIPDIPVTEETTTVPAPAITEYRFGGIMALRNGNRMVWLNGSQIAENDLPDNMVLVEIGSGTSLSISVDGNTYLLKPGQVFNTGAGRIQESFERMNPSSNSEATATPVPVDSPDQLENADSVTVLVESESEITAENVTAQEQSELAAILEQLDSGEEGFSEAQLQQALEILTQQGNAAE